MQRRMRHTSSRIVVTLAEVAEQDASYGKIFVEIGPVKAKGGNLDVSQLLVGLPFQPRIAPHGKGQLEPALHLHEDAPTLVVSPGRFVMQSAHATFSM